MPNTINQVTTYLSSIIDAIYQQQSVSSVLDAANSLVRPVENNPSHVQIPSLAFDEGLAPYNKESGFDAGTVALTWEILKLTQDRGRSFSVDAVDNIETLGIILANMAKEFIRTKVAPEVDAYRFAKYATKAGTKVEGTLDKGTITDALDTAFAKLRDLEVGNENLILFMSNEAYGALTAACAGKTTPLTRKVDTGLDYWNSTVIKTVPADRFKTTVTTSTKGFQPGKTGINFLLVDKGSPVQVVKHSANRLFAPGENLNADAWKWDYRIYHDAFVPKNKVNGLYINSVAGVSA